MDNAMKVKDANYTFKITSENENDLFPISGEMYIKKEKYFIDTEEIDQIFDGDEVYDSSTTTKKEFRSFVDGLTTKQFEAIQQFYLTCPKLSHTFTVVNPNTGKESEYTIEGLQSFFA